MAKELLRKWTAGTQLMFLQYILFRIMKFAFRIAVAPPFAGSDVRARLGSARPDDGLRKSKPEPQALKSLSRPKPWAQAAALHT